MPESTLEALMWGLFFPHDADATDEASCVRAVCAPRRPFGLARGGLDRDATIYHRAVEPHGV